MSLTALAIAAAIVVPVIIAVATLIAFRREDLAQAQLAEAVASGLDQPPSLHPVVDTDTCIGSAACVDACPESVLGRVAGLTQMVSAGDCIGHGRCHASCPVGAIALVFGTAERGVDIPLLRAGYESNVDGLFIVGELGGMGLIRNAMRQGQRAVESIAGVLARPGIAPASPEAVDTLIVGAGPAGIAAAVACVHREISFRLLEQFSLGGSVTHYPRRKVVFTEPIKLPIVGRFGKSEMLKEELIAEMERALLACGVDVLEGRRVSGISGRAGAFTVRATREDGAEEAFAARTVILAIGRRGTPRHLDVPGEDLPHVVYRLIDAEQYRRRRVLCVGGGDSAVEAAVSLAAVAGTTVYLSYRGEAFFRVKKKNRDDLDAAVAAGRVTLHLQTEVREITRDTVRLEGPAGEETLAIDDVIVNVGGVLPTPFLESLGVEVETKHGEVAVGDEPARKRTSRRTRPASSRRVSRRQGRDDA